MSALLAHLRMPRPRRVPRQACVQVTCLYPECAQFGLVQVAPSGACAGCSQPVSEIRTVTR